MKLLGSPHIHAVLFTNYTFDQLAESDLIQTKIPPEGDPLRELVLRHQIHRCTSYCKPSAFSSCRFGYPFAPSGETYFEDDKIHYKCTADCAYINPYNPLLLAWSRCNMDIQLNKGSRAMRYLCKYLTKFDTAGDYEIVDSQQQEESAAVAHFRGRQLGIIEVCHDVLGWHKEYCSRTVIYISTNLLENEYRVIRRREHMPEENAEGDVENPENVTYKTDIGIYYFWHISFS